MRQPFVIVALACVALAGAGAVHAQEGQTDPATMEQLLTKLMTPGEQHRQLALMAGSWTTTVTSFTEGQQPTVSEGTFVSEPILGGRYMLGRYAGIMMGQAFEGLSIDGYDNGKQRYFSLWFDSMGTNYYLAHGSASADGKTFWHRGTMELGPMEILSRSETVLVDDDTVKFTMWQTMGGQEIKAMEMVYKRVK